MKYIIAIMLMMGLNAAMAQTTQGLKITPLDNGAIKIEGTDALGANIFVVYNHDLERVYQERTENELTTFVRYKNGKRVDFGTFSTPDESLKSTPVVIANKDY